ncbi:hypothetical protein SADUNF_Sadunf15G0000700 [Salix dunnii]|uniref:Uncharacterized protein n=1 Tax=Salix dunnii TaxID=1413687 RepID=A0A835JBT7_9ROSI|nr:hypothetical protein SADUNF_Sadunf15G0000700 [Salix dunnii]
MSNSSSQDSPEWLPSFQTSILALSSDSAASSPKASPSRGDTIDSPSSDEDNHLVATTSTDSPLNKISKAKGGAKKRKVIRSLGVSFRHCFLDYVPPCLIMDLLLIWWALVEREGESIDLSGDMGAVGRLVILYTSSGNSEMHPGLKGTLEGFSFFSEDETDKITKATAHLTDQNEDVEEPSNGKKPFFCLASQYIHLCFFMKVWMQGVARKKGKTAVGKPRPVKKVRKKIQLSEKANTKYKRLALHIFT